MKFKQFQTALAGTLGAIALLGGNAIAQCPNDDILEDNDTCATAVPISVGTTSNLAVFGQAAPGGTDSDYYVLQGVPDGDIVSIVVSFTHANGDIDAMLWDDAACTNQIDSSAGVGNTETLDTQNTSGAAKDYYFQVRAYANSTTFNCNDYTIDIVSMPDPCLAAVDDGFEDNEDCATAAVLTPGTYLSNFVSVTDQDYYAVSVPNGGTLTVDAIFTDANGDVDIYLYDNLLLGCGTHGSELVASTSTTDNESVSTTNSSGASVTYYIEMYVWAPGGSDCNTYDLVVDITGGSVATPMCFGDGTADAGGGPVACPCGNESTLGAGEGCKSSLGFGAILTASGSNVVANDDMVFSVSQARASQPSLLVQGATLQATPFKDGVFCMGNPTERIEVVFTDGTGAGSTTSSIVTEGNITPGVTRYYQQWFRDPGGVSPCGNGSNFSQGLQVDWI
ncbi:MAG: PPC domain-containing protein [Planctomycetes bacterium]|nr:PPC domain-containing protein [Planctomycetota bacterium]